MTEILWRPARTEPAALATTLNCHCTFPASSFLPMIVQKTRSPATLCALPCGPRPGAEATLPLQSCGSAARPSSHSPPDGAEDVRAGNWDAEPGQDCVDLVATAGPQAHQLVR